MTYRPPFDPSDPADAMADMFRRQIAEIGLAAMDAKPYRELDPLKQLECFMGGVLTGLLGVCFAHVKPEGYSQVTKAIKAYLPQARMQAIACMGGADGEHVSETKEG